MDNWTSVCVGIILVIRIVIGSGRAACAVVLSTGGATQWHPGGTPGSWMALRKGAGCESTARRPGSR